MVLVARVFQGAEMKSDHYLFVSPIHMKVRWYKKKYKP
jgi:hypothetical protein